MTTGVALALTLVLLLVMDFGAKQKVADSAATSSAQPPPSFQSSGPSSTEPAPPKQPAWMRKLAAGEKPPQFVLFSFDGASSKKHWDRVLPLARKNNAHVTGLLSGVYLVPDEDRATYTGPGHAPGRSSIGFGGSRQDVAERIQYLNTAIEAGHEIGTHYNGHYCAGDEPSVGRWNTEQWKAELDAFKAILDKARAAGLKLPAEAIRGGRTPCLEGDWQQAFPAMASRGLVYDTSHVSLGVQWPSIQDGLWEFPMPEVRVPALGRRVVMMDYNFWYVLNGAKEEPARAAEFTQIVVDTYRSVYQTALNSNRAPLVIGNHFNDWSGSAFSNAMEQYLGEVCAQAETVCATYGEVIQWMALQDPAILQQFRQLPVPVN
ncbi:polysaccharide deacetylase [Lentzea sp. NPDC051838]|uniref:polysaccharide deacetylase n=1 Tax=Lentzea sp. NPDC051838 TaxID=3154849 RepID=UPI003448B9DC